MKLIRKELSYKNKSKIGVIVIHGFTSNTGSIAYFAEKLFKAGFNVEAPLLSGHGTKWEDLNKVSFKDWINDLEDSYQKLKRRSVYIFVAGISMGGSLACRFAEIHPELKGAIIINPAIKLYKQYRMFFLPVLKYFQEYQMLSDYHQRGDIKDPEKREDHYDRNPLKGVHELYRLLKVTKKNLKSIKIPVLLFQSSVDRVLPVTAAKVIYDGISSKNKKLIILKNSYHLATADYDKDLIIKKSAEFVKKHCQG